MNGFLVSVIRPEGYVHSDAFREVAETLVCGFQALGYQSGLVENTVDPSATNVVLGAHLLTEKDSLSLPPGTIIYNLEQMGGASLNESYYRLAERLPIWDYSPANLDWWKQRPCLVEPVLVEIGFAPQLRRIERAPEQDIDVLFYGSLNERRIAVLRELERSGVRVQVAFGVYGRERDALIARAKIVLNLHCYETKRFEVVRVSYLLANSKAVVSESSDDMAGYENAVATFPYEQIVDGCTALLADEPRRRQLEERGYAFFRSRPIAPILARALPATRVGPGPAGTEALRELYLDLMQKCLINLIYEDPNQDRWSPHVWNERLRESGRDWPRQAHSMIGNLRMGNLRRLVEQVLARKIPGDLIETGAWRGGACIMMRAVLRAWGSCDRTVWVADSFCGLPPPDPSVAADAGDQHHTFTELAVSLDEVKANFRKYGLLDDQVRFLKGWFRDTLPGAPIERLAILRVDGDMYESTMDSLTNLYDKVSPGGFVIIDDFGAVPACRQATLDFRKARKIEDPIRDIDGFGVFWEKTKPCPGIGPKA